MSETEEATVHALPTPRHMSLGWQRFGRHHSFALDPPRGVSWLLDRTEFVLKDTRLNKRKGFWRPASGAQWWGLGVVLGLPSWSLSEAPP